MCDKVCVNKLGLRNFVRTTTCPSQVMKAVMVAATMLKKPAGATGGGGGPSEETALVVAKKKKAYDIDAGDSSEEAQSEEPAQKADKNMLAWFRRFEGTLHQALSDIGG